VALRTGFGFAAGLGSTGAVLMAIWFIFRNIDAHKVRR